MAKPSRDARSLAQLTHAVFGESMTMDEVFAVIDSPPLEQLPTPAPPSVHLWVGSIGYERHKTTDSFVERLTHARVERLIDVRELPISRRRGYAKTALGNTLTESGIEYVHMRGLGNPKRFRDLYKSGHTEEGRAGYERFLLSEQREALHALAESLHEKRCALMCVEHDHTVCHRAVIFDALGAELGLLVQRVELD